MSIEVKNLTKLYGAQRAVDGISMSVGKGEIVGFLGPNGAGKSTTMKIISGYLSPDAGEAFVAGIPVATNPMTTKQKIGYLPEQNPLYTEMYVREYLDFIADVHQVQNKEQRIEEVIKMVGLQPESKKRIAQLSKGYKQRVGLAAALIHDPEVLILDEPTTGLDPNQIVEIREVIRSLGKEKTVLFSSHILQEVEAICDRVIIIYKGKVVADDLLSNLQKNNSGQQAVAIEFSQPIDSSVISDITGVASIETISDRSFRINTTNPEAVRRQLLERSLQHNLNIVSLQSGEQSLEDVFRLLTGKGNE
ncbi:MAG TPA: gliding motility-associated ABC transporter ATP-binding subunit GldA [Flavitalea sp.]|nr:gliding motility-associated ABC transporter ATP-binding subunit GldA [Flavitalea sp.]